MNDSVNSGQTEPHGELREQIQAFVQNLRHPVLFEESALLFDLSESDWRLETKFGKALLEIWNQGRSIVRRVEAAEQDGNRLRLLARRPRSGEPVVLEICESDEPRSAGDGGAEDGDQDPALRRSRERGFFEQQLMAAIGREFPGFSLERVSHRSDREHSFSASYTRGVARQGTLSWAFLGLSEHETPAAAENVLASGLIWLDWLRRRSTDGRRQATLVGLKLILPPDAVAVAAHRAAYLQPGVVQILEWKPAHSRLQEIDLRDYGNVETRLTPRWKGARLLEQLQPLVREILGRNCERVRAIPDATGDAISLRVLGLQVARIERGEPPKIYFGLEGETQLLDPGNHAEFAAFLENMLRLRRASRPPDRSHPFYRLQPERWLESLLVDDIARVDPAFVPEHVYPQVPAFSGPANPALSRGVIDILGVIRGGSSGSHRLAVVELKLDEDLNLPLQGLDYWLRVKWLQDRDQFRALGYFTGLEPSAAPPVVYLVCPAFRFHSTTDRLLGYFHPSIRVVKVGINQRWRDGVKVLFRRTLEHGKLCEDAAVEAH